MTFVVTETCVRCRFTDCVEVCPVEFSHGDEEMLYIDPDVCIDCGACVPACPVEAIYHEALLPSDQEPWVAVNAERSRHLPVIKDKADPHPDMPQRVRELGFAPR